MFLKQKIFIVTTNSNFMFRWFFGGPGKNIISEREQFKRVLKSIVPVAGAKDNTKKLCLLESSVKKLLRDSRQIYLEGKDIIKKIAILGADTEVLDLRKHPLKAIEASLNSNEKTLRNELESILEKIDTTKSEFSKQVFKADKVISNFKEEISQHLTVIETSITTLCRTYDFLESIHFSAEEIEFYTMKKRGKTLRFDGSTEMYVNGKKRYILLMEYPALTLTKYNLIYLTGVGTGNYAHHLTEFGGRVTHHGTQFYNKKNHSGKGFENIEEIHQSELRVISEPDEYAKTDAQRFRFFKKLNRIIGEDIYGNVDGEGTIYEGINVFMQLQRSDPPSAQIHGNPRNKMG